MSSSGRPSSSEGPVRKPPSSSTWEGRSIGKYTIGDEIDDRYKVLGFIGKGGMGEVWLVEDTKFEERKALKTILADDESKHEALKLFIREMKMTARMQHPNVVVVYDAKLARDGGYIVMEYINGKTIKEILDEEAHERGVKTIAKPYEWVTPILEQLCDVLQFAHDQGIVHRDLKPANLMLAVDRRPGRNLKVMDFGIARRDAAVMPEHEGDETLTKAGTFRGSYQYSSPEQIQGHKVSATSDLYSVGIILYELLTGKRPFDGQPLQVMASHLSKVPPPFAKTNPEVKCPKPIEDLIIQRMLAKDPKQRPQSAQELISEYHRAVRKAKLGPWQITAVAGSAVLVVALAVKLVLFPSGPSIPAVGPTDNGPTASIDTGTTKGGSESPPKVTTEGPSSQPGPESKTTKTGSKSQPKFPLVAGFQWIEDSDLTADGHCSVIENVKNKARYHHFAGSYYLPEGYEPEGSERNKNGLPLVLVRSTDKTLRYQLIEGGTFWLGDLIAPEQERHTRGGAVRPPVKTQLSDYYIQFTEVTNGEIQSFVDRAAPGVVTTFEGWRRRFQELRAQGDPDAAKHPAVQISWQMARDYARQFNALLPSEAQWEFAVRSRGQLITFVWGNEKPGGNERWSDWSNLCTDVGTKPVGTFHKDISQQNILDLCGNVQEFCRDIHESYPELPGIQRDWDGPPERPGFSASRVVRGASFSGIEPDAAELAKTTNRAGSMRPDFKSDLVGFRLVLEAPSMAPTQ